MGFDDLGSAGASGGDVQTSVTDTSVSLVIAGSGGAGVVTAGALLLEAAAAAGWYAWMTRSSGPQIRGGEAAAMLRLATGPIHCHDDNFDLLVAIDWDNIERFAAEIALDSHSLVIGDPDLGQPHGSLLHNNPRQAAMPFKRLAATVSNGRPNMVALGAIARLTGLPPAAMRKVVQTHLTHKGQTAIDASLGAFQAGFDHAASLPAVRRLAEPTALASARWSITGNEATGLGAIRGGVRFVAGYPITPATEVLEWMAPSLAKIGGVLVQAEDELASINQIIGASYGGTPALTATSGPGLSLMMESLGLAVAAEVPIVVVDVMRGGPSTGIPTKSEQADLNIAVYGFHGDAPHLVLAPASVADCVLTTQWAVHLAEALQTPAIVLTDQVIGQSRAVIAQPEAADYCARRELARQAGDGQRYQRYALTGSGVSPMAIPGTPGLAYTADGLEHNESGTPSSRATDHQLQLDKRSRKLASFDFGHRWADVVDAQAGPGDIIIITWGSSSGPAREALQRFSNTGGAVRLLSLRLIAPAQPARMAEIIGSATRALVVEQSHSGQFYRMLRAFYELPREVRPLYQAGPLPIRPGQILDQLNAWRN
ncbi:2-oxoglutarate ferredoxin oxidoreductase, alpha subunit [Burkholderiales bacterium]|nr:2-oxoglutarate ferredoxin oxidoreductase, alpha subunit [Burkholderiales bacterium]